MYIKGIILSSPPHFERTSLAFNEYLNVIHGKNGSGKSLLASVIVDSLQPDATYHLVKNATVKESIFSEVTVVENQGNPWTIRLNGKDHSILGTGGSEKEALTGIPSSLLTPFMRVPSPVELPKAWINHATLIDWRLQDNEGLLQIHRDHQQNRDDTYRNITERIEQLQKKRHETEKKLKIQDLEAGRKGKLSRELERLEIKNEELDTQLTAIHDDMDTLLSIQGYFNRLQELNRKKEEVVDILATQDRLKDEAALIRKEIASQFPGFSGISDPVDSSILQEIQEAFFRLRDILSEQDQYWEKRKIRRSRFNRFATAVHISTILATGILLYKNSFSVKGDNLVLAAILVTGLSITPLLSLYQTLTRNRNEERALEERKDEAVKKIRSLLEKSGFPLEGFDSGEVYEVLFQYFEDFMKFMELHDNESALREKMIKGSAIRTHQQDLDEIHDTEISVNEAIDSSMLTLTIAEPSSVQIEHIQPLIDELRAQWNSLHEDKEKQQRVIQNLRKELAEEKDEYDDTLLKEELAACESEIERSQKCLATWTLFQELLADTVSQARLEFQEHLIAESRKYIETITGSSENTSVTDSAIHSLLTGEQAPDLSPQHHHITLLGLTLAMHAHQVEKGISLPLILDDPFLLMDEERIAQSMELLLDISSSRQVLLFTHNSTLRYDGEIIELNG